MRILLITPRTPYPPVGGDRLRLFHLIRFLSERHDVRLLTLSRTAEDLAGREPLAGIAGDVRSFHVPRSLSLARCSLGLVTRPRVPLQTQYFRCRALARAVGEAVADGVDVALASLIRTAPYVLDLPVPAVVDVQDSISMHYRRALPLMPRLQRPLYEVELPRVERLEREVLRRATAVTAISPVDLEDLRRRAPDARLELVGNGVDLDHFRPAVASDDAPVEGRIVFLGNLRTLANRDMVLWFAREVFPRIVERNPRAHLVVVGLEPPPDVRRLHDGARVTVTGRVDDPAEHLRRAWLTVCPMRWGAGVQNKVLESMATGTPVVLSPMAAAPLDLDDGQGVRVAGSAGAQAAACLALLADRGVRDALGREGRAIAERRFRWIANLEPLDALLREVSGQVS